MTIDAVSPGRLRNNTQLMGVVRVWVSGCVGVCECDCISVYEGVCGCVCECMCVWVSVCVCVCVYTCGCVHEGVHVMLNFWIGKCISAPFPPPALLLSTVAELKIAII